MILWQLECSKFNRWAFYRNIRSTKCFHFKFDTIWTQHYRWQFDQNKRIIQLAHIMILISSQTGISSWLYKHRLPATMVTHLIIMLLTAIEKKATDDTSIRGDFMLNQFLNERKFSFQSKSIKKPFDSIYRFNGDFSRGAKWNLIYLCCLFVWIVLNDAWYFIN